MSSDISCEWVGSVYKTTFEVVCQVNTWGTGGPGGHAQRELEAFFYNVHLEAGVLTTTDGPKVTAYLTQLDTVAS